MNHYSRLQINFPEKAIFWRLGGNSARTVLDAESHRRFKKIALTAFEACEPKGRWEIFPVKEVTADGIYLSSGSFIAGGNFAAKCRGINALWCGAVTVGSRVTALRDEQTMVSAGAIYDAVAAECADEAADVLQELARQELLRRGMLLDERRYSPGYGDMPLEVQKFFFSTLNLAELAMVLSENLYIIPEKSVTAFAGVKTL